MYSVLKNVQILVAYLKEYDIRDIVMSPGGSDIPLIHSMETDSFFNCYSVVDERSAVYFAIGLSQENNRPVACVCTSGTAVSNYMPGMTEAFYQDVPILAITADKDPLFQGQLETQKIDQNIFGTVTKKHVDIPLVNADDEARYAERLVCEAITSLTHHGCGPAHININTIGDTRHYINDLPKVRKIDYVYSQDLPSLENVLNHRKKIMVTVGQDLRFSQDDICAIEKFSDRYDCVILTEHTSNLQCKGVVRSYPLSEVLGPTGLEGFQPDIVISMGNNYAAYNLKPFLRNHKTTIEHWQIDEQGRIRDVFQCLTKVIEMNHSDFFSYFANKSIKGNKPDHSYFLLWKRAFDTIDFEKVKYSNFYVAKTLSQVIPENSILHLAILNSTRVMQFFDLKRGVRTYSNLGALGIDGCLSTFMGAAAATKELAFCLIGDLSYFYDMNATGLRSVGNNVRIILLNNGGGSEFQFFMGREVIPTIDRYICAEHKKVATGWAESLGYKYFKVNNKEELDKIAPILGQKSDKPIFVEVIGDMVEEANHTRKVYANAREAILPGSKSKEMAKTFLKTVLPDSAVASLKKAIKR